MENRSSEMVKGRKYRVVTEWGEQILTFWGIMKKNGNPLFCKECCSDSTDPVGCDSGAGTGGIKTEN